MPSLFREVPALADSETSPGSMARRKTLAGGCPPLPSTPPAVPRRQTAAGARCGPLPFTPTAASMPAHHRRASSPGVVTLPSFTAKPSRLGSTTSAAQEQPDDAPAKRQLSATSITDSGTTAASCRLARVRSAADRPVSLPLDSCPSSACGTPTTPEATGAASPTRALQGTPLLTARRQTAAGAACVAPVQARSFNAHQKPASHAVEPGSACSTPDAADGAADSQRQLAPPLCTALATILSCSKDLAVPFQQLSLKQLAGPAAASPLAAPATAPAAAAPPHKLQARLAARLRAAVGRLSCLAPAVVKP